MCRLLSSIRAWFRTKQTVVPLNSLPDFENFTYQIAVPPTAGSKVEAWSKLREAERRLAMVKWTETLNDPRTPQMRTLLNDAVSAFLLTFEATIQFLKNQYELSNGPKSFYGWLNLQPQHDIIVRGLRTLRHFEAHVEAKPSRRLVRMYIGGSRNDGTSETDVSTAWQVPKLQDSDIAKLQRPPLTRNELPDWNDTVMKTDLESLFTHGLEKLKEILKAAEALV